MEQNKDFKRETVKKVLRYVSGYWYYLAASILLALLVVVLTLCVPRLTGDAIDWKQYRSVGDGTL